MKETTAGLSAGSAFREQEFPNIQYLLLDLYV